MRNLHLDLELTGRRDSQSRSRSRSRDTEYCVRVFDLVHLHSPSLGGDWVGAAVLAVLSGVGLVGLYIAI